MASNIKDSENPQNADQTTEINSQKRKLNGEQNDENDPKIAKKAESPITTDKMSKQKNVGVEANGVSSNISKSEDKNSDKNNGEAQKEELSQNIINGQMLRKVKSKMTKARENELLKMKSERKIAQMHKMENEGLFEALCEIMSLSEFSKEQLFAMIKLFPSPLQEKIVEFCNEIENEEQQIAEGLVKEMEGNVSENALSENEADGKESVEKANGEKSEGKDERAGDGNAENGKKTVEAKEKDEANEKALKAFKDFKELEEKLKDEEVLLEATIETMTDHFEDANFTNKEILEMADAASMIDELWRRVNWIGKYKLGSDEDPEVEKKFMEKIDRLTEEIEKESQE